MSRSGKRSALESAVYRKCCKSLRGKGAHEPFCPHGISRQLRAYTSHRPGVDAVGLSDDPKYVRLLNCLVLATTELAVLISYDDEDVWLPRSIMRNHEHLHRSTWRLAEVEVLEKYARKHEVI